MSNTVKQPNSPVAEYLGVSKKAQFQMFSCVAVQLYPTLCDPMDCSMPGFPVLHHLPEFVQTRVC